MSSTIRNPNFWYTDSGGVDHYYDDKGTKGRTVAAPAPAPAPKPAPKPVTTTPKPAVDTSGGLPIGTVKPNTADGGKTNLVWGGTTVGWSVTTKPVTNPAPAPATTAPKTTAPSPTYSTQSTTSMSTPTTAPALPELSPGNTIQNGMIVNRDGMTVGPAPTGNYIQNGQIFNQSGMVIGNTDHVAAPTQAPTGASLYPNNPRAAAAYDKTVQERQTVGGNYLSDAETQRVAKAAADFWVNNPLAGIEGPLNDFLTGNPVGQAVAPVLQTGIGVSTNGGVHAGMPAPASTPGSLDIDGLVNSATQSHTSQNPPLSAPGSTPITPNPSGGSLGTSGGGWNSGTQLPASKVSTLSDGTQYTSSVVNGQTVYTIVKSPYNPSAVGKTVDNANFDNILSGKPFTPVAPAFHPPMAPTTPTTTPGATTTGTPAAGAGAAAAGAGTAAAGAATGLGGAVLAGAGGLLNAGGSILAGQTEADAAEKNRQLQKDMFDQIRTDQAPWRQAGTDALGKLGSFFTDNPDFGMAQFQADPGYSFRLKEGMDALQNSAAAKGGLLSGNTLKAITNYGQEAGSQEYNNAYNRYNTNRGAKLNNLQSLAGVGQTAVNQVGQATQNYATNAGNALMSAGSANASGYKGMTNALSDALGAYTNGQRQDSYMNALLGSK